MKDGTLVPKSLAEALEKDVYALKIFMDMSIAYQKLSVHQMTHSEETSMRKRVEEAIEGIRKYGEAAKKQLQ